MKHELPGLHVEQDDIAVFRWTTPTGRTYTVPPPHLEPSSRI